MSSPNAVAMYSLNDAMIELTAWITACSGLRLVMAADTAETALTAA